MVRLYSPAHEGSRGMGAPSTRRLCDGSQVNIRAHPSFEPARDIRGPIRVNTSGRHGWIKMASLALSLLIHRAIAQERKEDPGQPAREGDHRDALAAPGGDAAGPLSQRRRPGIVEPE